jgi:Fibronectin type III domain/FG-GAP-like repeat
MTSSRISLACPLRLLVVAVLATAGMLVPAGSASAADTATPVLSSFSVSDTSVSPGQQVTFSYVATEGAGSLSRLRLSYLAALVHSEVLTFEGPLPVAGSVTITVPDTWANGLAILQSVVLTDPSGNEIGYSRLGQMSISPSTASGPTGRHTLPISQGDLTIAGSTVDSTVPTLTSISVSGTPASPGQTISVHYEATEAAGSLKVVLLRFLDPYGIVRYIGDTGTGPTGPRPLKGVVDQVIPATWPNGAYVLDYIILTDPNGNSSSSDATGKIRAYPAGAQGPSSHALDLGAATFAVSGSTVQDPPLLTSVRLTGSPMLSGGTATLSYTRESQAPLALSFKYIGPYERTTVFETSSARLTGTLPVKFLVDRNSSGTYRLESISARDSAGNTVTYRRDGSTLVSSTSGLGKHTFALPTLDVYMGPPPSVPKKVSAHARSTSAFISWNPDGTLDSVSKYTVTAQPGGRSVTTGPQVRQAEFTGLTNGTTYTFTVSASNGGGTSPASRVAVTPMMSTNILSPGDFNGDGRRDLIALKPAVDPTNLGRPSYLYSGNGRGGFARTTQLNHTYTGGDRIVFSPGDYTGDGSPDVMIVEDSGTLWLQTGNGKGAFDCDCMGSAGLGWGGMRTVFGAGDFSGDRKNDIMGITRTGDLYLYRGTGNGWLTPTRQKIGQGWGSFLAVFSPGDFSGDGKSDVMAVSKDGSLYLFRGNGLGRFAAAGQKIGSGWGGFHSVFSPGDFSGDRRSDVMAVNSAGDLLLFRGNGRGGWASGARKVGSGWDAFR